ncbi:MAG TPA: ParB/RepB/Spo0J family partition protein [Gammaproteobacteria bacterium]|jgi:ParB family chromosome partitioning protein|nr:ParB/RepB/Spo0J family partition protein [Gammaproteobacteria bacterium]
MSKKKRFGISEALTRGLSETIHVVENNAGIFRNVVLPLSRVELDPDNPRKLAIDLLDVKAGIRPDDPFYPRKQEELEKLKELAHTIEANGVINPIVVYKREENYRIVAGERRCLASLLAGKQEIEARIFNEKPKGFELKLIQWVENTAREDLSLGERLDNLRDILQEYQHRHSIDADQPVTATLLKSITGLSLSQATYYVAVLNAPADVQEPIQSGAIRSLDKAALIASINASDLRQQVIDACILGSSLKALRSMISQQKSQQRQQQRLKTVATSGRPAAKINMGVTLNTAVIKTIVESVIMQASFGQYAENFAAVNWSDFKQATRAFRHLVNILEIETVT